MINLTVEHLVKRYARVKQAAVNDVTFKVADGEILVLVGPSGCGKTTTLRLIAGLERPDAGEIAIGGRIVASDSVFIPPEKRGLGMVFQDHALFPHLTVYDNIAFGLHGKSNAEVKQIVSEMLHLVGLEALATRYPHVLSGGERQRVALARALAPRPALVLMDEPFSSLDADLRKEVREHVRHVLKAMKATVVFVTHDQEEALYMGDRLAVLQQGHLHQVDTPEMVYHASATRFVAEFMGNSSFLKGEMSSSGIVTEAGALRQQISTVVNESVEVAVRADDVDFYPDPDGNGVIEERMFQGMMNVYRLRLDSGQELHSCKEHVSMISARTRVRVFINAGHPLCVFHDGRRI